MYTSARRDIIQPDRAVALIIVRLSPVGSEIKVVVCNQNIIVHIYYPFCKYAGFSTQLLDKHKKYEQNAAYNFSITLPVYLKYRLWKPHKHTFFQ